MALSSWQLNTGWRSMRGSVALFQLLMDRGSKTQRVLGFASETPAVRWLADSNAPEYVASTDRVEWMPHALPPDWTATEVS